MTDRAEEEGVRYRVGGGSVSPKFAETFFFGGTSNSERLWNQNVDHRQKRTVRGHMFETGEGMSASGLNAIKRWGKNKVAHAFLTSN